jgi:hypothetical protein
MGGNHHDPEDNDAFRCQENIWRRRRQLRGGNFSHRGKVDGNIHRARKVVKLFAEKVRRGTSWPRTEAGFFNDLKGLAINVLDLSNDAAAR